MIPGDKSYYPGTDVLINKFDIRDAKTLEAIEYKFAAARELELRAKPIPGNFDLEHLKAIHRHLFSDVYDWAGKPRDIDFAKRDKASGMVSRFTLSVLIDDKANEIAQFLKDRNNLKGLPKAEFLKSFAEIHTKLNEMHPFREGNGRSTRVFLTQLAREAGFNLDLTKIDKDRWNHASHKAQTQYDPKNDSVKIIGSQMDIRQVFHESLTPTMAHAFTAEKPDVAMKTYPQLKAEYDQLDALKKYADKMPDKTAAAALVEAGRARIIKKLQEQDILTAPELQAQLREELRQQPVTGHAFVAQNEAVTRGAGQFADRIRRSAGLATYGVTQETAAHTEKVTADTPRPA